LGDDAGLLRAFAPMTGIVSGSLRTICFARFLRVFGGYALSIASSEAFAAPSPSASLMEEAFSSMAIGFRRLPFGD
jgi:hypothetical protein